MSLEERIEELERKVKKNTIWRQIQKVIIIIILLVLIFLIIYNLK